MASTAHKEVVKIAKKYLALLREHDVQFETAFLFGSAVSGNINKDSDIDIAIIMRDVEDRFFKEYEFMKLRRSIDLRIEPHIFTPEEIQSPFYTELQKTGQEIK